MVLTVQLTLTNYRQGQVVIIKSPADAKITKAIKLLKTSKWSQTLRTWYAPYSIEVLYEIKDVLGPICTIDAEQLKRKLKLEQENNTKNEYIVNSVQPKIEKYKKWMQAKRYSPSSANTKLISFYNCLAFRKNLMNFCRIMLIGKWYLLYTIIFFMFQSSCFAQKQPLFNLNNLINYPLTSLYTEARSIGLQEYVYGNIPDTVNPRNVQWLVIGNNPAIDQNIEKYYNVRYLDITVVGNSVDYSFFKVFKQIEILQLNISVDIPNEISYLKNLGILKILTDRNISFDGLRDLPRLKLVHIEEGQIQTVPRYLNTLDSLIHFALFNIRDANRYKSYYEGLTTIKDWSGLSNNRTIENITLQRCGLTEIPQELISCSNLKTLKFEENPLQDFKNLGKLTQIQNLSLKSSLYKIDVLPNELLLLKQLKSLNLFQVNTRIDLSGISKLYFLEEFICNLKWDPKRERIPEEISSLTNLKKLILRNSYGLKSLSGIERLQKLEFLDLESCSFEPNINELITLHNLKSLNLSNNTVKNFHQLSRLASIERLSLSNCGIRKFSFKDGDLKHLKSLDLTNNPDCVITGPISKLPKLQIIYGSKKLLPENIIAELKGKGVILYLSNY